MKNIALRFFYAVQFLTAIPIPLNNAKEEDWGRISPYFTFIGILIGSILYLASLFLDSVQLPVLLFSTLIVSLWIVITCGLHFDGLMDSFDGIGCQKVEKKPIAMRDSRVGAIGAMAGILVLIVKVAAVHSIVECRNFHVLIIALALSRLLSVYALSYLKDSGLSGVSSSLLKKGLRVPMDFFVNLITFAFLIVIYFFNFTSLSIYFFTFVLFSIICGLLWIWWMSKQFDGLNGDNYGAIIELSEVSTLIVAVFFRNLI